MPPSRTSKRESEHNIRTFAHPPLVEVALAVAFKPLDGVSNAHIGAMWNEVFRDAFPEVHEHPAGPPAVETFDESSEPSGIQIEIRSGVPPIRYWFLNADKSELLQIQKDKFVRNWRKEAEDKEYPRYHDLRKRFLRDLESFQSHLTREGLGEIQPTQTEVTYVNHLDPTEFGERHEAPDRFLKLLRQPKPAGILSNLESSQAQWQYRMTDDNGEPVGRLRASLESAIRVSDSIPIFKLTLATRGRPEGEGMDGMLKSLDRGHRWIVNGFIGMTTDKMHKYWGLEHE